MVDVNNTLVFFVNGKKVEDSNIEPEWTLLFYLRQKLRLCGTKLGCGEGGCGACTVMVSRFDRKKDQVVHYPVNACLAPVCSMHGLAVTTVEGIGSTKTKLHPVQERIAKAHGSQCGFCTPGMVMSMYTLLRNAPKPRMEELEIALQGNLCRCTGYRPIMEGYKTFTEEWERIQTTNKLSTKNGVCGMGDNCCKLQNGVNGVNGSDEDPKVNGCTQRISNNEDLFKTKGFVPYDPSQEPIFPPELRLFNKYDLQYLIITGKNVTWYRPTKLSELLDLKKKFPNAKLVVGNTEVGVEVKFKNMFYPVIIQPIQISELTQIIQTTKGIKIGAAVTLDEIQTYLKNLVAERPEYKVRIFKAAIDMIHWFAGKQIRSVGSLGSNIMTGSPISDMIPILMAVRAELEVQSIEKGTRTVILDDKFFVGYRQTIIKPEEILLSILIPYTKKDQYFEAYKQARRREDDIAIVNAAINVTFEHRTNVIKDIFLAFGGMSFKTVTAPKTENNLKGLQWNRDMLEKAYSYLLDDLPLDPGAPGGMTQYRKSLVLSLFFKAFLSISQQLQNHVPNIKLDKRDISGIDSYISQEFKTSQYFTIVPDTQEKSDALQRPIVHMSAFKQATGEAVYLDDIPFQEGELYCGFVVSSKAHANIVSIDESEALAMEGVHGFVSGRDLDEKHMNWGAGDKDDDRVFHSDKVTSQGQIIGLVVADTQEIAQKAARKVKVVYEELHPIIVSIEDAIKYKSFLTEKPKVISKGDIDKILREAPHVVEGECKTGGQEHFYFETQSCLVIPKAEDGEMEIICSTQNPTELAMQVSHMLDAHQNKIISKVKRIGGGFGGKESRSSIIVLPIALAARKFNRPIRCMLDRYEDMLITGGRHPFLGRYKVAFDDSGRILGMDVELYSNAGHSTDLSVSVLERALKHTENSYNIPACRVTGYVCKTNLPSNTAFRAFGGPQGMFVSETMIQHISDFLKKERHEICRINLHKKDDLTIYNQKLIECTLDKCWKECFESSDFQNKRKKVDEFNRENRYKKRGLNILPLKYGVAFSPTKGGQPPFLNQGGALILVYTDGSVLLTHGGVEMGQGLHTKMIQIASRVLEIPVEKIYISETATDKVPNTSPTVASQGSDLNGMAVLEACTKIKERLKPFKEANPDGTWEDWVLKAYFDRVSLSATGFYMVPDLWYDFEKKEGNMYNYFTYGAACSEVEIDTLTGDHQVLSTEIVMDLGESLNPAIDIGQIEGAYMQGYGLFVLEEMMYSPMGDIYTRGPGTYKIPGFGNLPGEFNVSLLKGVSNPRAVFSSKAVGEPPLFAAGSVIFAIQDAIKAAREENNIKEKHFRLDSPATSAKIRMACQDFITSQIKEPAPGTFKPWNIEP